MARPDTAGGKSAGPRRPRPALAMLMLLLAACATPDEPVPAPLRPFIARMSAPLLPLELPDYVAGPLPERISAAQALEDVELLRYLLDNAYSGRDYWQQRGVDFPAAYAALRQQLRAQGQQHIDTRDFEQRIAAAFVGINDPHTAVIGHDTHEFFQRVRAYFASLVIARQGGRLLVLQSADPAVPVGAEYLGPEAQLFPTLAPGGTQHYLLGRLASEAPRQQLSAQFSHGELTLELHACRIGTIHYDRFHNIIESQRLQGVPVLRSSSFWVEGKTKELEAFAELGKQLRSEPVFIWNLLGNDGGITQYPAAFIENFNGFQQDESWEAHLHSTAIAQAYLPGKNGWSSWPAAWLDDATPLSEIPAYKRDHVTQIRRQKVELLARPRRYWELVRAKPAPRQGDYTGQVLILSNHRNGSAGNNALAMSKSIPRSLIVGENSNMSYAFANTRMFSLKHSRIKLRLPGRLIINPANSIELGFLPDLWLDSATPVEELLRWLREPERYQFSYATP